MYQYIPKDKNNKTFISRISVNKFDSSYFMVEVDENKQKVFVIKKKENYSFLFDTCGVLCVIFLSEN